METYRMCISCRKRRLKTELIKVVKNKNGTFDITNRYSDGRGCYICCNKECIELAVKKRLINRAFKCEVPKQLYEKIMNTRN